MNGITRIEKDKGTGVVIIPTLFGDDEVVVPKGRSVLVPVANVGRNKVRIEGLVVDGDGKQRRVSVRGKQ